MGPASPLVASGPPGPSRLKDSTCTELLLSPTAALQVRGGADMWQSAEGGTVGGTVCAACGGGGLGGGVCGGEMSMWWVHAGKLQVGSTTDAFILRSELSYCRRTICTRL